MIWGINDTEWNFDFIIILVAMATERKKTKKYLKIFSSKTTDQILMKHHQKHQCNMGSKWGANDTEQNFDFIIILVAMAMERKIRITCEKGVRTEACASKI